MINDIKSATNTSSSLWHSKNMDMLNKGFILDHVWVSYASGQFILKDISLTFKQGYMHVICGPNGCGKSTLLKALARLNSVGQGTIYLDDIALDQYHRLEYAKKVAFLPQSPHVPVGLSVRELILRGRYPYRTLFSGYHQQDKDIVDEMLELTNLSDLQNREMSELSGGQRQRAWIAMALAQESEIVLLDEPTTYLDLTYQLEVLDLLKRLNQERGLTIITVLHDLMLSARYADILTVMHEGKLWASGSADEVLHTQTLRQVFRVDAEIIQDPVKGTPLVIPRSVTA